VSGLSLSLLGPYSATLDGQPLGGFRTRLAQALFIYLACEPERQRREYLMALFWPGLPQASAQKNLRQNLYLLRRAIPEVITADGQRAVPFVLADNDVVQINSDAVVAVDARRFAALIHRIRPGLGELEETVALYRGDFLTDFYLPDSNPFEEWAAARREACRRGVLLALEHLAAILVGDEDFTAAETYARRQLVIDPLHETGHRQLIEVLARSGRRSAALAHFDDYRRLLHVELGVKPGSETLALMDAVQSGELLPVSRRPDHIRGYDIHEELGRGSYGVVFRASQPTIGRDVAIKVIPARVADDVTFIRRFEAEAQTIARLEHPQIVPLYDYWREPGSAYLVMRYLRGGNLKGALGAPWDIDRVVHLLEQVAAALAVAHRSGIVHRDVKPANILLDEDGNAYLTDFGIAKLLHPADGMATSYEGFAGTPEYISPEQALSEPVTPLSDQYSLGLVVYEALNGRPPFAADSLLELLEKHVREPLPPLHERLPGLSPAVDEVLRRAIAKQPEDRYPDVAAFAEAFGAAAQGETDVTRAVEPLLEVDNPYKGLLAFTEADAALFFGREALTSQLVERLAEGGDHQRFLAVVGPSGSGKSSLISAGLVPALRRGILPGSGKWFVLSMTPGSHPYEELETALLRIAVNPPSTLLGQLQDGERGLLRAVRRALPPDDGSELLLIIDQFEELFTLVPDREVTAHFLASLVAAVTDPRSPLRVIATLRADFYDRPLLHPGLSELMQSRTEVVVPLNTGELVQAVERPAARVGVVVQPELITALVADVNEQPGALPLLQYTLSELFEGRENGPLTLEAYRQLGGISGALRQRAEAVYDGFDAAGQMATRALFYRLVTLGEGVEDTRRRLLREELAALGMSAEAGFKPAPTEAVVEAFGRARLLSFDRDPVTREPTVEIAHEALLRAWPRLRAWLDEDRAALRLSRLLTEVATEWEAAGRDGGFLLRGARLDQLSPLATGTIALTEAERGFLATSLDAREARRTAEETRRQAEIDTAQKLAETERQRADEQAHNVGRLRRRAALLAGALGLAVILAVAAILLWWQAGESAELAQVNAAVAQTAEARALEQGVTAEAGQTAALAAEATTAAEANFRATAEAVAIREQEVAVEQTNLATSRELYLATLNTLETDPELSILLALQALETAYTREAEEGLHRALQTSRTLMTLTGHTDELTDVAYSPDGSRLATAGVDGTVKLWDGQTGQLLRTLPPAGPRGSVFLTFNDTGTNLAVWSTYDEDTENLYSTNWDTRSGEVVTSRTLSIPRLPLSPYLPSPDWTMVSVDNENGTTDLWDVETAQKLQTFSGEMLGYGFSPDGLRLATGNRDGAVTVWDLPASFSAGDGRTVAAFDSSNSAEFEWKVAFNSDGSRLALGFTDGSVEIWDLTDTSRPLTTLRGLKEGIFELTYSADDRMFAASAAGEVAVWDTATGNLLYMLSGHRGGLTAIHFSPDGRMLATAGGDGTARIWQALPQANGELFNFPTDPAVFDLELSPNDKLLALGSGSGPAVIKDAYTGELLLTLPGEPGTAVYSVAFHPDGARLATVGADNVIRVWDAATGEEILAWTGHEEAQTPFVSGTLDVDYSPDGTRLATAGVDGIAKVWDATTGEELRVLAGHTDRIHSIAFSPNGRFIATSSGNVGASVKVWDSITGAEIYTFIVHPVAPSGLTFSPDSNLLVSSGGDGVVRLFDLTDGTERYSLPQQGGIGGTTVFTPNGENLITSGGDDVRVWDVATGTELLALGDGRVIIDLTRDGRWLYSGRFGDDVVRVGSLLLEDTVALAHERLTRWWRPEECLAYLHTEECPPEPEQFAANE
jgi:WD40 repeat protein/DNA-binding SARP family transcriptional activator